MALREVELVIQSSQVPSALTDFPVLVARSNLPNEVCDPSGSNNAQADGGDLKFYSDSGLTTQIACEVVAFAHDSVTDAADAAIEVWVKVPSVSAAANTSFYMTYNEASVTSQPAVTDPVGRNAVWSDYAAVLHLEDATDSTGNTTPTVTGALSGATGKVGGGYTFDGVDDRVDAVLAATIDEPHTFQAWGKLDVVAGGEAFISIADKDVANQQHRIIESSGILYSVFDGSGANTSPKATADTAWHLDVAVAAAANDRTHYRDGASVGTSTASTAITGVDRLTLGTTADSTPFGWWDGVIDEARVRASALSADWIAAEYNNQNSPSTFIVEGTPADSGGGGGGTKIAQGLHRLHDSVGPQMSQQLNGFLQ